MRRACAHVLRDHPRLRGEKSPQYAPGRRAGGSPPLTRGKVGSGNNGSGSSGITPAYAGKSLSAPATPCVHADHPRLRGEKFPSAVVNSHPPGSPPLTRGKEYANSKEWLHDRITPAYAGKSFPAPLRRGTGWDHPRLRGEKFSISSVRPMPMGITPAYAGKSSIAKLQNQINEDHPRLRGEKKSISCNSRSSSGSPPLTRGKGSPGMYPESYAGITPAYAGKRDCLYLILRLLKDHPRLRGEKVFSSALLQVFRGSPPLTRGKASRTV